MQYSGWESDRGKLAGVQSVLQCSHYGQTNIPIFKIKESAVRRRYRDFEWLKKELERDSKVSA